MKDFINVARAFSDMGRVRAMMALRKGELCVCQIIALLRLAASTVSKHMTILKQAGLVESRKDGRWIYYRLPEKPMNPSGKAVLDLAVRLLNAEETIINDETAIRKIVCRDKAGLCRAQRIGEA